MVRYLEVCVSLDLKVHIKEWMKQQSSSELINK